MLFAIRAREAAMHLRSMSAPRRLLALLCGMYSLLYTSTHLAQLSKR